MARKGLGKGLGALLGSMEAEMGRLDREVGGEITTLAISKMSPSPFQPRQQFDQEGLAQLAQSLASSGMLQPILVRPSKTTEGHYDIIAGERRWRAAQIAQMHDVPVFIRELDDKQTLEAAVLENVQRQDLSAIEEARGYQRLVAEFGYSAVDVAETIGKSRPHVANMLRLLELPGNVQKLVDQGKISAGHARALVGLDNAAELARFVLEKGLNVRQLEALVRKQRDGSTTDGQSNQPKTATEQRRKKDADTLDAERRASEAVGLPVSIDHVDGRGSITVHYQDFDQLDDVLRRLGYDT